uniref:Uncharacterized protein n=1 Tax=Spongospora subterranea TaxID=70186 RepID=A0A0H5QXL7_9EUKA|eukprot:CRZ06690.1 hypothetical protein [Spongospora subterranea]
MRNALNFKRPPPALMSSIMFESDWISSPNCLCKEVAPILILFVRSEYTVLCVSPKSVELSGQMLHVWRSSNNNPHKKRLRNQDDEKDDKPSAISIIKGERDYMDKSQSIFHGNGAESTLRSWFSSISIQYQWSVGHNSLDPTTVPSAYHFP